MRADALLWWTKGSRLPPLVTTSPAGTPAFDPQTGTPLAGALTPAANTTVLFGDSVVNDRFRAGPDITMGLWLDCCNTWGIEGDYFDLGRQNTSYDSGLSNGSTILARPFFNTEFGYPDAELAAFPGELAGQVTAQASTEFHSAGFDFRHNLYCQECCPHACECGDGCGGCAAPCCNCCPSSFRLDAIAGYRNYDLSDDLAVEENLITTGGPTQVGTQINVTDSFHTRNAFNGMDLGLIGNAYYGCWSWQVSAKAALGWENQAVTINGSTVVTTPDGTVATSQGGLLALQTNIGTYSRNEFVVIPELGMEVGYQITPHLRGFFGYNFLYWGDVARAGDQVTLNIDPRNLPGAPRTGAGPQPAFTFNDTSFWAQGIRLGAELRY